MAELMGVHVPGVPTYGPKGMRVWIILCVSWMTTLAITSILLRLLSRRIRKQSLWWDDYMIMFSMIWNWAVVAVGFAMYIEGVGYHADTISTKAIENISMWLLVTEVIYIWNLCWTKLSLLLLYYRIFRFPFFKKQVVVVGSFVIMWATTVTFLFTFICVPVQKLWKPSLPGHCVSELGVWLANASSTIFSDMVILLLPIPQVWKLQLRIMEKVGLTLVFSLGFFAVFASSYRTWVLFNYSKKDISYTLAPLLVWSDIEMCVGIISACLPTLRPAVMTAAAKLGISDLIRFSDSSRPQLSGDMASEMDNRGVRSASQQSLRDRADSARLPRSNVFYNLSDDSVVDGDLVSEVKGHKMNMKSNERGYELSSIDIDELSESIPEEENTMQRVRRLNTFD